MSQDFTTRLQLELREAALRHERRGAFARLRTVTPRPPRMAAVAALAAAVLAALVLIGGLGWHREQTITAPRVTETFPVTDTIASMATGFGSVWVTDPSKPELLRVDPSDHKVTGRVDVTANPLVTVGAGAVWVVGSTDTTAQPRTLLRIDPESMRVTARTHLRTPDGEPFDSGFAEINRDGVWVLGRTGVVKVDAASGRVTKYVPLAERPGDPMPLDEWVTDDGLYALRREGRMERYDLRTGKLAQLLPVRLTGARIFVPTPEGLVMVSPPGRIALAEPERGAIVWDQRLDTNVAWPVADGRTLWMFATGRAGDQLYAMDLRTGAIRSQTPLPQFGSVSAIKVGDALWIGSQNGKVMVVETPPAG